MGEDHRISKKSVLIVRVYTVTCMDGQCGSDATTTLSSTVRQQISSNSDAQEGPERPVNLRDFQRFTREAAEQGVQLSCPCTQTNIAFEAFSNVGPEQIGLCKSMLSLFYDPMSENSTTAK